MFQDVHRAFFGCVWNMTYWLTAPHMASNKFDAFSIIRSRSEKNDQSGTRVLRFSATLSFKFYSLVFPSNSFFILVYSAILATAFVFFQFSQWLIVRQIVNVVKNSSPSRISSQHAAWNMIRNLKNFESFISCSSAIK